MVLIVCNAPTDQSSGIAQSLVQERLAACVTRTPVWSTYRWEGEVLEEEEHTLTIKTAEHSVAACKKRLLELHPYEVPEILVVPVDAERSLDAYVRWVREECLPDS